jgi:hypothetical protein
VVLAPARKEQPVLRVMKERDGQREARQLRQIHVPAPVVHHVPRPQDPRDVSERRQVRHPEHLAEGVVGRLVQLIVGDDLPVQEANPATDRARAGLPWATTWTLAAPVTAMTVATAAGQSWVATSYRRYRNVDEGDIRDALERTAATLREAPPSRIRPLREAEERR